MKMLLSYDELKRSSVGDINYRVNVTNSGKMGGATSVLAFVTSSVSQLPVTCFTSYRTLLNYNITGSGCPSQRVVWISESLFGAWSVC